MGVADMLGKNGIFISDEGREKLKIDIPQDKFDKLKEHINTEQNPEELKKCYLTNNYYKAKEGLFLDKSWLADAIEQNIKSQEKLQNEFKEHKLVVCSNCGSKIKAETKIIDCSNCGNKINTKKYYKSIKLSSMKKTSLRLYIKYLRGDVSI